MLIYFEKVYYKNERGKEMQQEYIVNACSGKSIEVRKNQIITIIDMEGEQVADFLRKN